VEIDRGKYLRQTLASPVALIALGDKQPRQPQADVAQEVHGAQSTGAGREPG
jgi:hypothetical protein